MALEEAFKTIAPSVVALCSRFVVRPSGKFGDIPDVIGTGFIVDSRGLVITAGHVARTLLKGSTGPEGEWLPAALLYREPTGQEGVGFEHIAPFVPVLRFWRVSDIEFITKPFYGEDVPDIAMVQLGISEVPAVTFAEPRHAIRTGRSIAFAGFPLGSAALNLELDDHPPVLLQTTPFLRHGIISSVNPFPLPAPHGFTIDAQSHSGASGSPIFDVESGKVLGMIYAAFEKASITYALPGGLLISLIKEFLAKQSPRTGTPTMSEYLADPSAVFDLKYGRPILGVGRTRVEP